MEIICKAKEISTYLSALRATGKRIGFVPTMGALHEGHLRLVDACRKRSDFTVTSIFVNPLQFNNPEDFKRYPLTLERDQALLEGRGCDMLFHPDEQEMYPEPPTVKYHFGDLEKVMEGQFRPGHFNGVGVVVKRLFDLVMPDLAFFGEKDYQQLLVVKRLVEMHNLDIEIVPCPIVREADGLAMSSRNVRLSPEQRQAAPHIYRIILEASRYAGTTGVDELKAWVIGEFGKLPLFKLEYFELSDARTLAPVRAWKAGQEVIACVAVFMGEVRLIDNVRFFC